MMSSATSFPERIQSPPPSAAFVFSHPGPSLAQVEHSARLLDALDLTVRVTGSPSVAVVERAPGCRAVRFVCGIGGLASPVALDDVLWLVAEPGGGTQSHGGVALVPLGTHHAIVLVGTERELMESKLYVLARALRRLAECSTATAPARVA